MNYRQITDDYSVSGQIIPEEVAAIKAAGFRSVICNRPDNEQPGQPPANSIKASVEAAGLEFRHIPVVSGQITEQDVADQAAALESLPGPVFAYCRSGGRSASLFTLAKEAKG